MDRGISLEEAVARHLRDSGFPADGGINERWVTVAVGPVSLCFPNIKARREAVEVHDYNHVLSGYGHDDVGEAEIGAWELGGGCKNLWVAWILNWAALVPGAVKAPGRLLKAFARGRRTGNLYGADLDGLRGQPVEEVRALLGLDQAYSVRPGDVVLFIGLLCVAPLVATVPLAASIVTSPWWLAAGAHKRRRAQTPAELA
jgi:hypothetical protein